MLPAALGWLSGEFLVAGLISGLSAVALKLGHWGRALLPKDLHLREAFVVNALAYPLFSLSGCDRIPAGGAVHRAGSFESMSGFTTTGLTVVDVESLPRSLRFFRAYIQCIGGAGIVILSVAVWHATRPAGFRFRYVRLGDRGRTYRWKRALKRSPVGSDLWAPHRCGVRGFCGRWNAARGRRASRACDYFYR